MSEITESRAERIAKYKEERRKQLAAQFASISPSTSQTSSNRKGIFKDSSNSSGSEAPRTTRASRLRAAAVQEITSPQSGNKYDSKEVCK